MRQASKWGTASHANAGWHQQPYGHFPHSSLLTPHSSLLTPHSPHFYFSYVYKAAKLMYFIPRQREWKQIYRCYSGQNIDNYPKSCEELRNSLDLKVFQNLIAKNIVVARCFETQEPYPKQTYSLGLLQNMQEWSLVGEGTIHTAFDLDGIGILV